MVWMTVFQYKRQNENTSMAGVSFRSSRSKILLSHLMQQFQQQIHILNRCRRADEIGTADNRAAQLLGRRHRRHADSQNAPLRRDSQKNQVAGHNLPLFSPLLPPAAPNHWDRQGQALSRIHSQKSQKMGCTASHIHSSEISQSNTAPAFLPAQSSRNAFLLSLIDFFCKFA